MRLVLAIALTFATVTMLQSDGRNCQLDGIFIVTGVIDKTGQMQNPRVDGLAATDPRCLAAIGAIDKLSFMPLRSYGLVKPGVSLILV